MSLQGVETNVLGLRIITFKITHRYDFAPDGP